MSRRVGGPAVTLRRALTGHVTEAMQRHYSLMGMDEKRAAIAGVIRLVQPARDGSQMTPSAAQSG